jgi:hypothetical protein
MPTRMNTLDIQGQNLDVLACIVVPALFSDS